ncbi:hypothetical protein SGLAM104S_10461 [Streptomyces glaucescens]
MPTYLTPGVYVEEVQSGARPIEGVGTAVAAFVGFAGTGLNNGRRSTPPATRTRQRDRRLHRGPRSPAQLMHG